MSSDEETPPGAPDGLEAPDVPDTALAPGPAAPDFDLPRGTDDSLALGSLRGRPCSSSTPPIGARSAATRWSS